MMPSVAVNLYQTLVLAIKENKDTVALAVKEAVKWRLFCGRLGQVAKDLKEAREAAKRAEHERDTWQQEVNKMKERVREAEKEKEEWITKYEEELEVELELEELKEEQDKMKQVSILGMNIRVAAPRSVCLCVCRS